MPSRLFRFAAAAVAVAGFLTQSPRASADYILDDFNSPSPGEYYQITLLSSGATSITYPNPMTTPNGTSVSPTVSRFVSVTVTQQSPSPTSNGDALGTIGGGVFTLATPDSAKVNSTISYSLTGASSDLSGATGLGLGFVALDPGLTPGGAAATASPVTITLTDSEGRTKFLDATVAGSGNPFTASFDFSSFGGDSGFDFSQVSKIDITLNGGSGSQRGIDLTLDNVKVNNPVPAPPAVLLAGIGVLALVGRARLGRKPTAA